MARASLSDGRVPKGVGCFDPAQHWEQRVAVGLHQGWVQGGDGGGYAVATVVVTWWLRGGYGGGSAVASRLSSRRRVAHASINPKQIGARRVGLQVV